MKSLQYITTILILTGFLACNSTKDKKAITIEDRKVSPGGSLSVLVDSLRPSTQTFVIKGDRDTLLVGQKGTILTIPKNTFVNSQGLAPASITISLVEVNNISGIIGSNLQTTSGDNILQTGGMFFIDAKEGNKSLGIAKDKSIYVEVKSGFNDPNMKVFEGKFDRIGKIDWTVTGKLANDLIPIPLSLMNWHKCDFECGFSKGQTDSLSDPKYENSFIATREFEDRCYGMIYASCPQMQGLSSKLLELYTGNIDKPLFYSDSLVVDYLATHFKDNIDTFRKFEFDDTGWITYMFQLFTQYKSQHLTNTINFDKLGITERTTIEELIARGHSETESAKYLALFKVRNQVEKERKAEKQVSRLATYSFAITKLGWVNVDRFLDEKYTDVSTFLVNVQSKDTLDHISISLAIPAYNVAVFSIHKEGNLYSFTKKDDGYKKLPVGEDAIIVGFSYKENKPYYGMQKIKITNDGQINLTLSETTEKAIKLAMEKL
jgi:hypothetical protein